MSPPHHQPEPLRQQFLRSLAKDGKPPLRIVVNNECASDWLIRVGPLARQLNEEARGDCELGEEG